MSKKPTRLSLSFGALSDPIKAQLAEHGISARPADAKRWQAVADAITMCFLHGVHTESATHSARQKLIDRISRELNAQREGKSPKATRKASRAK